MSYVHDPVKVSDNVYWVGAVDWGIRDFHGYSTHKGTTYNAYLVLADKVTLIDTVKAPFRDELMTRISELIDPKQIDYIVANHAEMDHSGALPAVISEVKPQRVYASKMGVKALADHFLLDTELVPVKDGESLSLGNMELTFLETRMLHWPDSMFSYLSSDKLLFSSDAFGMHFASAERFADEVSGWEYEAAKYFANILMPYSPLVTKLLGAVADMGLAIDTLCPDHGPIWRKDLDKIMGMYGEWAKPGPSLKAVVTYDTMWQSTDKMARAVADGLVQGGCSCKVMPLSANDRSDVVAELIDSGAVIVGSPTLNNNVFPTVGDLCVYLKGLKPKHLMGASFGSYGWSGEAAGHIRDLLADIGVDVVSEPVKAKFVPTDAELSACFELGRIVAEKLTARKEGVT